MARKIIVMERLDDPNANGDIHFRYAFWLVVPATRTSFYAAINSGYVSAIVGPDAPTNTENTALRNGSVTEVVLDASWPNGSTIANITSDLAAQYAQKQAELNGYNPWSRYGSSWDGTTWTTRNTA